MWASMVLFLGEDTSLQALVETRRWGDNLVGADWSKLGVISSGGADGVSVGQEGGNGARDSVVMRVGADTAGTVRRLQEVVGLCAFGVSWANE